MSISQLDVGRDLRRVERAKRRLERAVGPSEVVMARNDVTEMDRELFGTPVRFEIDVCVPIDHLKTDLNIIRAELANCIKFLEQGGTTHDRRFGVHRKLSAIRARLHLRKKELADPNLTNVLRE